MPVANERAEWLKSQTAWEHPATLWLAHGSHTGVRKSLAIIAGEALMLPLDRHGSQGCLAMTGSVRAVETYPMVSGFRIAGDLESIQARDRNSGGLSVYMYMR